MTETKKKTTKKDKKFKHKMILGVEIEGVFDRDVCYFDVGHYHDGEEFNRYWDVEDDSSVTYNRGDRSHNFDNPTPCEWVSRKLSRNKFIEAIENFIENISDGEEFELKEVCDFNKSCGCHIHIGLEKDTFYRMTDFKILKDMRSMFFGLVARSKILQEQTKKSVRQHYFRGYARRSTKNNFNINQYERQHEFNIRSEMNGRGLEWRSFNICGVETWAEFREMFNIALSCIDFLFDMRTNGYQLRQQTFRPLNNKEETLEHLSEYGEREMEITNSFDKEIEIEIRNPFGREINVHIENAEEVNIFGGNQ